VYTFRRNTSPRTQYPAIRETMEKNEGGFSPRLSAPKPPTQVLEPEDSGPRLKVEVLIWNSLPEKVMEIEMLKSQGTGQKSISRSISKTTHEHTSPGPRADISGARDLAIDGLYSFSVTDHLGGAGVDDGSLATDKSHPIDRNTVEEA
jgi:hypothetical protein